MRRNEARQRAGERAIAHNRIAIAVTLALFAAVGALVLFWNASMEPQPVVREGKLELTRETLAQGVVLLDGEWEFYPGVLLGPDDFAAGASPAGKKRIAVPNRWSAQIVNGKREEPARFGTYRLRLQFDDAGPVALKTGEIRSSQRIYLDGRLVAQAGEPKADDTYTPGIKPGIAVVDVRHREADLIVQTANFDLDRGSGIQQSIALGAPGPVIRLQERKLQYDWILTASLFMMGLYLFGLYFKRREDVYVIQLAGFCFGGALFVMTHGEMTLLRLLPGLPFEVLIRLQYGSGLVGIYCLLLHVGFSFRELAQATMMRACGAVFLCLLAMALLLPLKVLTLLDPAFSLFVLLCLGYILFMLATGVMRRYEGSVYMGIVALVILCGLDASLYAVENAGRNSPVFQALPFVGSLGLALLMSGRYTNAFHTNRKLSERLLAADRMKDEFLVRTSHEFRTPLHGIMNIADSLSERLDLLTHAQQRERLALIVSTAKRLSTLVHDIIDRSRLKEGALRLERTHADVRASVTVVLDVFRFIASERAVAFVNAVGAELPPVWADENRLRQVLSNLVDNALQHSGGETITVAAERREDFLAITVSDNGAGIPADKQRELETPQDTPGGGIGLGICRQLVALHGGELRIASAPGAGTEVTFLLPVSPYADGTPSAPRPASTGDEAARATPYRINGANPVTMLIVDDDRTNLDMLADLLAAEGYAVIAAGNGNEALEQLRSGRSVDLAILDVMMPGMPGYELCAAIRESYSMTELPVLMLTAAVQPEDSLLAFQAGANDFLNKPFDYKQFLMRIQSLLSTRKSAELAKRMELAFLQAQIRPHFIDNVLNTITALSYEDVGEARALIQHFSQFLRGSLSFGNSETLVTLDKEIELVRAYCIIEQYRFEERVRVEFALPERRDAHMPPLLLQPLVENAIRHGITPRLEGGTVVVAAAWTADGLVIEVKDDGVGMDAAALARWKQDEADAAGIGLRNVRRRLKHAFGTDLQVESAPGKGTVVRLFIPISASEAAAGEAERAT
ncbi:ATP-binding protein [Paenibacillus cymbidii]|uniref:ATP-binding protein n=1 Tax=Paenibacillus cymbidii TaxID=1639034 RepID=UPI00108152CA|nr:ATP-binding protein [Paenibacillus cymbidii]